MVDFITALIVHHGGLGGHGKGCVGVLGHHVAMVRLQGGAGGDLAAGGHIHNGTGGEGDMHTAGQYQNIGAGAAVQRILGLQTRFCPVGSQLQIGLVFVPRDAGGQFAVRFIQLVVDFFVQRFQKCIFQIGQGDQRITGTAGSGTGGYDQNGKQQTDRDEKTFFLHTGNGIPFLPAELSGWRFGS